MSDDLAGFLDAFGAPVRVKGAAYDGILDDDYQQVELGERVRAGSNRAVVMFTDADVRRMSLARGDTVELWNEVTQTFVSYKAGPIEKPRTDGFVHVQLIESA